MADPPARQRPEMSHPPIVEVVCGVRFEPLPKWELGTLAEFKLEQAGRFEEHAYKPLLLDGAPEISSWALAPPDARLWLIMADGFLLQVQRDRFYLNWRAQGASHYPRFHDRGSKPGIRSRALEEFARLRSFCIRVLGCEPAVRACEVAKVDVFEEGHAWSGGSRDLGDLLPVLAPSLGIVASSNADLQLQIHDRQPDAELSVAVGTATALPAGHRVVRLDTRCVRRLSDIQGLGSALDAANEAVNVAFDRILPLHVRDRFGQPGVPHDAT